MNCANANSFLIFETFLGGILQVRIGHPAQDQSIL